MTPTYGTWQAMMARCYTKSSTAYPNYGGQGVTVCERWHTFENFLADMGERPAGMSIDRLENTKGYEPTNCRWATRSQQNRSKGDVRNITYNGRTQCMTDWAAEYNLRRLTLKRRLDDLNWTVEAALTTPVRALRKSQ